MSTKIMPQLGKPILMTMSMMTDSRVPQQTAKAIHIIKENLKDENLIDAFYLFKAYAQDETVSSKDAYRLITDFDEEQLFEIRRMAIQFATEAYFEILDLSDSTHMILRLKMLSLKDDIDTVLRDRGYITPNALVSKFQPPHQA